MQRGKERSGGERPARATSATEEDQLSVEHPGVDSGAKLPTFYSQIPHPSLQLLSKRKLHLHLQPFRLPHPLPSLATPSPLIVPIQHPSLPPPPTLVLLSQTRPKRTHARPWEAHQMHLLPFQALPEGSDRPAEVGGVAARLVGDPDLVVRGFGGWEMDEDARAGGGVDGGGEGGGGEGGGGGGGQGGEG